MHSFTIAPRPHARGALFVGLALALLSTVVVVIVLGVVLFVVITDTADDPTNPRAARVPRSLPRLREL